MDEYFRPQPEEFLRRISEDYRDEKRGRLTIFFGYAPGVGKTYSMLYDAAMRKKDEGRDVVIGYVELHKRPETEALLEGFEKIPPIMREYNGIALVEPDVSAIMKRKPDIVLIDELAHTNAPGMKNQKRYQDVDDLLDIGINVYTTLNVQHLESLKDIVQQITDIRVQENVPDPVFILADEVKLIDLPIDDLMKRLHDGKIYTGDMAVKALDRFFKPGNLLALRQMALKQVAFRIDKQIAGYLRTHNLVDKHQPLEKVLVCISASPHAEKIVRAAYRVAIEFDAEITALHIETDEPGDYIGNEVNSEVKSAFDVANKLNIKTITLHGKDFAVQIAHYARMNKFTKIVVGKPKEGNRLESVDTLLSHTKGIDVYIFAGQEDSSEEPRKDARDPINEMISRIKQLNRIIRMPK